MPAAPDLQPETSPVTLHGGLPETVLPDEPPALVEGLRRVEGLPVDRRRDAAEELVRAHPRSPAAWATLGAYGRDDVESYACYRVGYHRGLDALRAAGWRGSGTVRWDHESNRGFLRSLDGLRATAAAIGEHDEEERCALFLRQLDPRWVPGRTGVGG
jgi:hypothetical protein